MHFLPPGSLDYTPPQNSCPLSPSKSDRATHIPFLVNSCSTSGHLNFETRSHTRWLRSYFTFWLFERKLQNCIKGLKAILQGIFLVELHQLLGVKWRSALWNKATVQDVYLSLAWCIQLIHMRKTWKESTYYHVTQQVRSCSKLKL